MAKRLNPRRVRWGLFFDRFNFSLSHWPGSKNAKPAALSHQFQREKESEDSTAAATIVPPHLVLGASWWALERRVKSSVPDVNTIPVGCLSNCLFVPPSLLPAVFKWGHSSQLACHPGVKRTAFLLAQSFWWPIMASDGRVFVSSCPVYAGYPEIYPLIT